MLDLCLLGTGGMMPLPKRALTALMTRFNGSSLLIDCGEGTQVSIREKGWSFHQIDVICFTHYHGDHISGLPGLLLSMGNAERTEPVTLVGPKGLERVVSALRCIAPELPFPIIYREIEGAAQHFSIHGYEIDAYKVNHNILCYGYSIEIPRAGRFDPEKAEKNQVPKRLWSRLQKGETLTEDGIVYTQDMILGPARKGIKVTYCTDSRPTDAIVEAAKGADLFICEGMYGEKDKAAKAVEHRHMTMQEAAKIAAKAMPKEVWLTHYSPSMVRPEEYLDSVKKIYEHMKAARDRWSLTLDFDKNE